LWRNQTQQKKKKKPMLVQFAPNALKTSKEETYFTIEVRKMALITISLLRPTVTYYY